MTASWHGPEIYSNNPWMSGLELLPIHEIESGSGPRVVPSSGCQRLPLLRLPYVTFGLVYLFAFIARCY